MVRRRQHDHCRNAARLAAPHQSRFALQHIFIGRTARHRCYCGAASNHVKHGPHTCSIFAGDPDLWAKMMDLNLNTPMRLTARFAPGMVSSWLKLLV